MAIKRQRLADWLKTQVSISRDRDSCTCTLKSLLLPRQGARALGGGLGSHQQI